MKVVPFIAESPAAALVQIHEQLGPEAVVVSVRPLPRQGLARFWQKSAVEVLACVAEPDEPSTPWERRPLAQPPGRVLDAQTSERRAQWPKLQNAVFCLPTLHDGSGRPHVFIGPSGTGKTTLLCKWMTLSVLNENRPAKVWRLDGASANTAEFLNIYGEMLGISVERFWAVEPLGGTNPKLSLIDVPGVQPGDTQALSALRNLLATLPSPRIHLVLNAAYETSILSEQFRAFASFHPEDLSFTHLDEEQRQGKVLDFVLGTNCSLRFLSTGQKIPGDLVMAGTSSSSHPEFAA